MLLSTISVCASEMAVAADCITFLSGKLLTIVSEKLERATSHVQARATISLCECLIDTLCDSNLRHSNFPPELIEHAHMYVASSSSLLQFFDMLADGPHASRLYGDMLVPARGSAPAVTLREIANKNYNGSVPILGDCVLYLWMLFNQLTPVNSPCCGVKLASSGQAAIAAWCRPTCFWNMRQKCG